MIIKNAFLVIFISENLRINQWGERCIYIWGISYFLKEERLLPALTPLPAFPKGKDATRHWDEDFPFREAGLLSSPLPLSQRGCYFL